MLINSVTMISGEYLREQNIKYLNEKSKLKKNKETKLFDEKMENLQHVP